MPAKFDLRVVGRCRIGPNVGQRSIELRKTIDHAGRVRRMFDAQPRRNRQVRLYFPIVLKVSGNFVQTDWNVRERAEVLLQYSGLGTVSRRYKAAVREVRQR